jgi:hypothetical protein
MTRIVTSTYRYKRTPGKRTSVAMVRHAEYVALEDR